MIEETLLLAVVQQEGAGAYRHLIRSEFFTDPRYATIYDMMLAYELAHHKPMSVETFCSQWPDIAYAHIDEQVEWWAEQLKQEFLKRRLDGILRAVTDESSANVTEAIQRHTSRLNDLLPYTTTSRHTAIALTDNIAEDIRLIRTHQAEFGGLTGVTSGFNIIDDVTHGTQKGEIELIVARPGNGKTLMLLYGAYKAVEQQEKVVTFISPEMSAFEIACRVHTMRFGISTSKMLLGKNGGMSEDDISYLRDRVNEWNMLRIAGRMVFREAHSLGRRFTTADIRAAIKEDKCELLCIDGLLLVDPVKPWNDTRVRLNNLMEELKAITTETGVPIRAAHQANRQSEVSSTRITARKKDNVQPIHTVPELHHLAESGATEQYANRVLCVRYFDSRMYIAMRKNRNGPSDLQASFLWDIDLGVVGSARTEPFDMDRQTNTNNLPDLDGDGFTF